MEELHDNVQTVYDQDPELVAKLEESAGFDYRHVVGQVSLLKEEEAKLEEILRQMGNLDRYGKKLDKIRSQVTRTRAELEALGKTPPQTAETAALSPSPQTPAGQAALQQREAMKRELPQAPDPEAVKALAQNYVASVNSLLNLSEEQPEGRRNPEAKIPASPGRSGSSGVYHKSTTLHLKRQTSLQHIVSRSISTSILPRLFRVNAAGIGKARVNVQAI